MCSGGRTHRAQPRHAQELCRAVGSAPASPCLNPSCPLPQSNTQLSMALPVQLPEQLLCHQACSLPCIKSFQGSRHPAQGFPSLSPWEVSEAAGLMVRRPRGSSCPRPARPHWASPCTAVSQLQPEALWGTLSGNSDTVRGEQKKSLASWLGFAFVGHLRALPVETTSERILGWRFSRPLEGRSVGCNQTPFASLGRIRAVWKGVSVYSYFRI